MHENKKIPLRQDIASEDKWAIEDLYPTDEAWYRELDTVSEDQKDLESFAGMLAESGRRLYDYLYRMEMLNVKADRWGNYCMRKADEDTRDPVYQAMQAESDRLIEEIDKE